MYELFQNCWYKAAASLTFLDDFMVFLFSSYCREIVLIYLTWYRKILTMMIEQKIICEKTYYDTNSFKIVQATNYQTGVRFSNWSRTLKLMALLKVIKQWVSHQLGSLSWNLHQWSTTFSVAFNSAFNWIPFICNIYCRLFLTFFSLCLRLNDCWPKKFLFLPFK